MAKALAFLTMLMAAAIPARASVARAVSFDEKVEQADSIVLGRCTSTRSQWDPTGRWILTYSTFQVEKALKGAAVPAITVVTPGGQVDRVRQETVGVPHFGSGDRNVLFVKRGAIGPTVLYLDQGAYRVTPDSRGKLTVEPVASSVVLVNTQTGQLSGAERPRPLEQFEQEVKAALDRVERGHVQRYDVTPAEPRASSSPSAELFDFVKTHRLILSLLAVAIAVSTYLLIKGR